MTTQGVEPQAEAACIFSYTAFLCFCEISTAIACLCNTQNIKNGGHLVMASLSTTLHLALRVGSGYHFGRLNCFKSPIWEDARLL